MAAFLTKNAFLLLCLYGIVASVVFHYSRRARELKLGHLLHLLIFFGLAAYMWVGITRLKTMPLIAFGTGLLESIVVILCNGYVTLILMKVYVYRLHTFFTSDDQLVVRKTYDRAEAAEMRKDYGLAVELYKHEVEIDPADGEAQRRLGEAYAKDGNYGQAASELQKAVELIEDPDKKRSLMLRISNLFADLIGDKKSAVRELQRIIEDYPESKQAGFARIRLEATEQEDDQK